jgi:hypothetical protein
MTTAWKPPGPGALDDLPWPDKLAANAIDCDAADDRIHGFSLLGDLARHYSPSEILYLSLVGELPEPEAARIFDLALASLASMSPREAPTHVAVLSRICAAQLSSAFGAGLIALAEQARFMVAEHAELLTWLANPVGALPERFTANDPWTASLVEAARARQVSVPQLRPEMTRDAARLTLLYAAGLRLPEAWQAAIVGARFSGLAAEALLATPDQLKLYPVKLPPFHYVAKEPT